MFNRNILFWQTVNWICFDCLTTTSFCLYRLRVPSAPSFMLMGSIVPDALVIAIVIFATNVSLAKTFAQRNNYIIDSNQVWAFAFKWLELTASSPLHADIFLCLLQFIWAFLLLQIYLFLIFHPSTPGPPIKQMYLQYCWTLLFRTVERKIVQNSGSLK